MSGNTNDLQPIAFHSWNVGMEIDYVVKTKGELRTIDKMNQVDSTCLLLSTVDK